MKRVNLGFSLREANQIELVWRNWFDLLVVASDGRIWMEMFLVAVSVDVIDGESLRDFLFVKAGHAAWVAWAEAGYVFPCVDLEGLEEGVECDFHPCLFVVKLTDVLNQRTDQMDVKNATYVVQATYGKGRNQAEVEAVVVDLDDDSTD